MRRSRLSIAALMGVVLFAGVGFAALGRPSRLAAALMFSGATAALTVALLGAVVARGRARAGWIGFAVCGWMYLLLQYGPFCHSEVGPFTLPTAVLDLLYPVVAPAPPASPAAPMAMGSMMAMTASGPGMGSGMGYSSPTRWTAAPAAAATSTAWQAWTQVNLTWPGASTSQEFYRIGHSLAAVIVAGVGAVIGRKLARAESEAA